jgi:hypothetical protein
MHAWVGDKHSASWQQVWRVSQALSWPAALTLMLGQVQSAWMWLSSTRMHIGDRPGVPGCHACRPCVACGGSDCRWVTIGCL